MSDSKRYDEKAVSQILRRAAELESGSEASGGGGLSRADIERVAVEAGLDPAAVRAAIAEQGQDPEPAGGLLGGPLHVRQDRVINGRLDTDAVEEVLELAQHELGMFGKWYRSGRIHSWSPKGVARRLQVRIQRSEARTEIRVEERLGPLAGGLWGGLFGGLLGASLGLAVPVGLAVFGSGAAMIALLGAGLAGSYLLTRAVYKTIAQRRQVDLARLADHLEAEALEQVEAIALDDSRDGSEERDEHLRGPQVRRSEPEDGDDHRRRRRRRSRD